MSVIYPTSDTSFFAEDSEGTALLTDGTYQEVIVPDGVEGRQFVIQVQATTMASYDLESDCAAFQWSSTGSAPGYLFASAGKVCPTPKASGGSLGYVKAAAGKNIVCVSVV